MIKQRTSGRFPLLSNARIYEDYVDKLIVPYTPAPVYYRPDDVIDVTDMKFSMVPSWSKEPKVKFATHNARLESIDEKPTWKGVFVRRHCLVPLTDFIEPIYEGDHAGFMVSFHGVEGEVLLAAGVWDEWTNRETGEVTQSFAIITHDPIPFVADKGHDRCPVFLKVKDGETWLGNQGEKPSDLKKFLIDKRLHPDLDVQNFRPMRPGWEKRK